ncbi:MAG: hypothetical protein NT013_18135 [Planctomycetia bacterium]|nr:hypothetical protein [Planctomycetia bacterium]
MSRRPPPAEQQFGSDSFLDVVANVVGILIILMVLAGVRASRAPVTLTPNPPTITTDEPKELASTQTLTASPDDSARHREELAALQSQSESIQDDLNVLRNATADRETRLSELQSQDAATRNRLASVGANLEQELSALEQNRQKLEHLNAAAQAVRVKLKKQQAEIATVEKQPHKVQTLQHRITPVSRVLKENETELHFRCFGGKVAPVPVEELVGRMKTQMERQKDFIVRAKRYSGVVGPVRGFSVKYVVEREESFAGNFIRVVVSQWEIVPEADLEAESSEAALRNDSEFRNEIRKAESGSTITFWVYPDSFSLYRQLQAIAHREGFTVAARPMPAGVPIMFSPKGSRSAAQ